MKGLNLPRLIRARRDLNEFVVQQAKERAHKLGFGWIARENAPSAYESLLEAHLRSIETGAPLPVSSLFCDKTIYKNDGINHAMRFWHDTYHVRTDLTFSLDDELELGLHHLKDAEKAGIKRNTDEWEMLRIDLLGQNYLLGVAGRFPLDQRQFVKDCLEYGLDQGVHIESRRTA